MWGINTHYQSNRINNSARPKIPAITLPLFKPLVTDIKIAIHSDNKPIKLQRFNVPNFSN